MQRCRFCAVSFVLLTALVSPAFAQFSDRDTLIGIDAGGPVFGIYAGSFEQVLLDDVSVYARAGYVNHEYSLLFNEPFEEREGWEAWSIRVQLGANYYPQNLAPEGMFAGVALAPGYVTVSDGTTEAETFTLGFDTQLGYRFVFGSFAIAPHGKIGYFWPFEVPEGLDDDNESTLDSFGIRFQISAGIDVGIAF